MFVEPFATDASKVRTIMSTLRAINAKETVEKLLAMCAAGGFITHRAVLQNLASLALSEQNEEKNKVVASMITSAVGSENAMSLLADLLDNCVSTIALNADSMGNFLTHTLKLPVMIALQVSMALCFATNENIKDASATLLPKLVDQATIPKIRECCSTSAQNALSTLARSIPALSGYVAVFSRPAVVQDILQARPVTHATDIDHCISLAKLIEELGPQCVSTPEDCRELLSVYPGQLSPKAVAEVVALLSTQGGGVPESDGATYTALRRNVGLGVSQGNVNQPIHAQSVVHAIKDHAPSLDWLAVVTRLLECQSFKVQRFSTVVAAYKKATGNTLPSSALLSSANLKNVRNISALAEGLKFMTDHPDMILRDFSKQPSKILPREIMAGSADDSALDLWRFVPFVEAAVHVASRDRDFESSFIGPALAKYPVVCFASLVAAKPANSFRHVTLAAQILKQSPNPETIITDAVVQYLRRESALELLVALLSEYCMCDSLKTVDIAEIIVARKIVNEVLTCTTFTKLAVAVAILGKESHQLKPENWLEMRLDAKNSRSHPSATADHRFAVGMAIVEVADELLGRQKSSTVAVQSLNLFINSSVAPMLCQLVAHAKLLLQGDGAFSKETETEATEFFRRVYDDETIDAVAICNQYHHSQKARDKQVFNCIVNMLFEETRCLMDYPWKSLKIAARLFGQLVALDLLPQQRLQTALRFIVATVSKFTDAKTFEYGNIALEQMKQRLPEWPHVGRQLKTVQDLDMRVPGVMSIINSGIKAQEAAERAAAAEASGAKPAAPAAGAQGASSSHSSGFHQYDIRILQSPDQHVVAPAPVVQDQINVLVGNTDPNNIDQNALDLARLLKPEFYGYFAEYLVIKRVSLEPNFHRMYLTLVEKMGIKLLEQRIRLATFSAVLKLLSSEKIRSNTSERSLLKNLGSWVGCITLAKNVPVLMRDLDFREMILSGLSEGKLIAVIPFIAKVLEQSANSRFFRPPNPWTMAQLANLVELYHLPDLKLTLRFEVEVLCKNLGLTVSDVNDYFSASPRALRGPRMIDIRTGLDISNSTDFRLEEREPPHRRNESPPPKPSRTLQADAAPYQPRTVPAAPVIELPPPPPRIPVAITQDNVRVSEECNIIPQARHQHYRHALVKTLEAAVKEVNPHVERSSVIAFMSTREIVVKDFCRDTDKEALRRAGQAMARSLASNLCTATIKEYLLASLKKNIMVLVSMLTENPQQRQDLTDRIAHVNFDLCVRHLEYVTSESAAKKIDEFLVQHADDKLIAVQKREFPIYPADQLKQMEAVPEFLRPSGPLNLQQRLVYDEFFQCVPPIELLAYMLRSIEEAAIRHYTQPKFEELSLTLPAFTEGHFGDHHNTIRTRLIEIAQIITAETAVPFVSYIFTKLMDLAEATTKVDVNPQTRPQWHAAALLNQVYLFVVQSTNEKGQQAAVQELTRLFLQHERRWKHSDVVANFIRLKAIDLARFDEAFSKALNESSSRSVVEFAGQVIQKVLIDDKLATTKDLRLTLQTLDTIAKTNRGQQQQQQQQPPPQQVLPPAQQVSAVPQAAAQQPAAPAGNTLLSLYPPHVNRIRLVSSFPPERRAMIEALFDEWAGICARKLQASLEPPDPSNPTAEKDQSSQAQSMAFVKRLQDTSMLKPEPTNLDLFLSVLMESSVEHYATVALHNARTLAPPRAAATLQSKTVQPPAHMFAHSDELFSRLDAFTDLIILLVRCCSWGNNAVQNADAASRAEVVLVVKVLTLVTKVLQMNHDAIANRSEGPPLPANEAYQVIFMQQPYVRFFSNLLIAIHRQNTDDSQSTASLLTRHFSEMYKLLSPQKYPGFAFGWLELLCHRIFVSRQLKNRASWPTYIRLLCDALRFADQFTKGSGISSNVLLFFKSILKVMLMLLHDFPEFVLTYHVQLCDVIPLCCVQIRNVVLCAFPTTIKLPDPFQQSLQIDKLSEMHNAPPIAEAYKECFANNSSVSLPDFERFLATRDASMLRGFPDKLRRTPGAGWNVPLINAVVLHAAMTQLQSWGQEVKSALVEASAPMELYRELAAQLDSEGRYYLLNACVNQLRYPNSHTHFFSHVVLLLFLPSQNYMAAHNAQEALQEQITRVLVERLIISRPHPWGLLITFIELIRNKRYQFWDKPFIRCTHEIEKMFEGLMKSVQAPTAASA
jgi:CCR4-NOT transcription complex subunit 1